MLSRSKTVLSDLQFKMGFWLATYFEHAFIANVKILKISILNQALSERGHRGNILPRPKGATRILLRRGI